jgi:threonine/homoserine/homoserine lactone efflux protein
MLEMIFSAFVVGFLVAIPPGTVTVAAAQKSISYGFKNSIAFTFGSCISDILYILIVFYGFAPLISDNTSYKIIFWFFSGILLFYFGIDALKTIKKNIAFIQTSNGHKQYIKDTLSGIGITLSNPMTIAGWLVIAGGFFTHWKVEWPPIQNYGIFSIVFMMVGVLCWFVPLLYIISRAKNVLNHVFLKLFSLVSGLFFISIALFSTYSAINLILNRH